MNASIVGYSFASVSDLPSSFPRTQPTQSESGWGLVLRKFCKIGDFFVRTMQRRVFARNILRYVNSKNAPIRPPRGKGGFCKITARLQEGCHKSFFFLALFIRLSCRHCRPVSAYLRGIKTKADCGFVAPSEDQNPSSSGGQTSHGPSGRSPDRGERADRASGVRCTWRPRVLMRPSANHCRAWG